MLICLFQGSITSFWGEKGEKNEGRGAGGY